MNIIEKNPVGPARASIIWLHGLGASNTDFVPLVPELRELTGMDLRFVFPQAPMQPVTINSGYVMPAWFDIYSLDRNSTIDYPGIEASVQQIIKLIQEEKARGFSDKQIIVAGFSQGAVVAMNTLLNYPHELGGIIALSGYLPPRDIIQPIKPAPVFMGHGVSDNVVDFLYGQTACEILKAAGYSVAWHAYSMAHAVCDKEVADIAAWLKNIL